MTRMTGGYSFGLLGSFEVADGGRPVGIPGRRPRALLAMLLLEVDRTVPTLRLIQGLWGAAPPKTARESVQYFVHQLRKALPDPEGGTRGLVETHNAGYRLRIEPSQLDVVRFQEHAREAGAALARRELQAAWTAYARALELWRGPALGDFIGEPFAAAAIDRLEGQRLAALEAQLGAGLDLGRHAELTGELEALVRAHPEREELRRLLMLGLYRCGRQAQALEAYQAARDERRRGGHGEPGARLQDLQRAILDQDPSLSLPMGSSLDAAIDVHPSVLAGERLNHRDRGRERQPTAAAAPPPAPPAAPAAVTEAPREANGGPRQQRAGQGEDPAVSLESQEGTVEPREERRLVTVLAIGSASVPDPSRAVPGGHPGIDPEDVRTRTDETIRSMSERILHYGGVVHSSAMGRLLGVFGADRSQVDDPERAVRAALDLLGDAESPTAGAMLLGAGVATGEAVVTHSGEEGVDEPATVTGDVLSTALGLQASAAAGTIVVGTGTWRATRRAIEYRPLQQATDQRQTARFMAWQALAPRGRTGAEFDTRRASPLTERDRELAMLTDLLGRFLREHEPQLLTIISEPGLGKSRLVAELARLVDRESDLIGWRLGRAQPHAEGPFGALAEIVKAHANILDTDSGETAARKLSQTVTDAIPDPDDAAWVTRQLRGLLGPSPAEPAQGDRQQEIVAGWVRFFQAAASSRPLVVVFEDLQWADQALAEFVEELAEQVSMVPLLVVATARPELLELRPGWGGGLRNAATLSLSPLSREGTGALLDALLGDLRLPDDTRGSLLTSSGGNPLYVEEYVRMLHDLDDAALERDPDVSPPTADGGSLPVPETGRLPIPESVQQLIAARLDTMPLADRRLLQDAAVIGQVFWVGALAAVSQQDEAATREGLRRLERREFLRRARIASVAGETEYAFRHALVRDVAYNQILRGERAVRHRRVAAWFQGSGRVPDERAEILAHHYTRALELTRAAGQPVGDLAEQTRQVLRVAGDRVGSLGALTAAARFYEQALDLWPADAPDRAVLLLRLGEARAYGQHTGADVLLEARHAFEAAGNRKQAAEVDVILAQLARIHGDHATAASHLERALALGPARSPELLVAMGAHAVELLLTDDFPAAIRVGQQAVRLGAEHGLVSVEGLGHHAVGISRLLLGDPAARQEMQDSVALLVDAGHATVDFARFGLPVALWWYGDLAGCVRSLAEQREAVRDTELVISWFDIIQAALDYTAGRWDAAGDLIDRYLARRGAEPGNHEPWCLVVRGQIRLGRGDLTGALDDADAALALAGRTRSRRYQQVAQALRGRALLAAGDTDQAVASAKVLLGEQHAHPEQSTATPDLAALLLDLDLPPDQLPRQLPPIPWHQAVRALAGRDLDEAADRFAAVGSPVDQAAVWLRLARRHADRGETAAATAHLDAAVSVYQAAGAHADLRRAATLAEELRQPR